MNELYLLLKFAIIIAIMVSYYIIDGYKQYIKFSTNFSEKFEKIISKILLNPVFHSPPQKSLIHLSNPFLPQSFFEKWSCLRAKILTLDANMPLFKMGFVPFEHSMTLFCLQQHCVKRVRNA